MEFSMIGLTEQKCREPGIVYEIDMARHSQNVRGQINGHLDDSSRLWGMSPASTHR